MKISVDTNKLIASLDDLKNISYTSLNNFDYYIIINDFKAYQYFSTSNEGLFQPNDAINEYGRWRDNSSYLLIKNLNIVNNDYDFSGNSKTEINSIQYYNFLYNNERIDVEATQIAYSEIIESVGWSGLTTADQRTVLKLNTFPTGLTEQEKSDLISIFFTNYEYKKLKDIIWKLIPLHRKKRYDVVKIKFGEFEEQGYITKQGIIEMWRDTNMLINEWIDTPSYEIYDWINSTGNYISNGFNSKSYYNINLYNCMVEILIDGIYDKDILN